MQFLVDIVPSFPHDWTPARLTEMLALETTAALELMDRGVILRLDRVVGRGGSVALWQTNTLEQLDAALASLPLAPYLKITVTPLMKHRVQKAFEARANAKTD